MYIGLDIGGTKIEGILFKDGRILESIKEFTHKEPKRFLKQIEHICEKLINKKKNIKGIGIGLPGIIDRKKGEIIFLPNIPKIKNIKIKIILEKKFNIPVRIENDGNCMAIAEFLFGEGKGKNNIVSLTLGTGIGGGIIINKKIYNGRGNAGELGHLTIEAKGEKCKCGSIGCFEEYAASRAIKRFAKNKKLKTKNPLEIENLARRGNKKAIEIYREFGYYLGVGLGTIIKILDPDIIILSGNLCHAKDLFLDEAKREAKKRVFFKICEIKVSKLKNASAIGAASLFLR